MVKKDNYRNKPQDYWNKRSLQRTTRAERQALPYIRRLREEYARSSERSIDNIRRIYENYFGDNGFDRQKLREIVPSGEFSKYLKQVRDLGVELPDNYAFRVNREEFAQAQLWLEMKKLGAFENNISNELYSNIIRESMRQTMGDYGVDFSGIDTETMKRVLNAKFYGKNFSQRIWGRTDRLADELPARIAVAIAKGQSIERTARDIRERFGVGLSSAERLIRTETNYFHNYAEIEAYDEIGVEYFEFLASLDGRTSDICRHHHKKRFRVKDSKAGVNTPPLHPNCRSTIVAVIPELEKAVDNTTQSQTVNADSYSEGEKIGVKIAKPKAVGLDEAINFNIPALSTMDQAIISAQSKEVKSILDEYSPIQKYLAEKGGLKINATNVRKSYIASVASAVSRSSGARASIVSLNLAKPYYRNAEKMREAVRKSVESGFFMSVSKKNYDKYVISHEMGHIIESFLMIRDGSNAKILAHKYENDILEIAKRKSGISSREIKSQYMSKYGKSNSEEFFAEAFAGLRNGVKNPITQAMKDFLKENIK